LQFGAKQQVCDTTEPVIFILIIKKSNKERKIRKKGRDEFIIKRKNLRFKYLTKINMFS
jgi:hypothetical protein